MRDEHEITLPAMPNTAPNVETYGATILREPSRPRRASPRAAKSLLMLSYTPSQQLAARA